MKLPDKKPVEKLSPQTPTVLFNAMINPMVGYGMRGAIWYQGESNRDLFGIDGLPVSSFRTDDWEPKK